MSVDNGKARHEQAVLYWELSTSDLVKVVDNTIRISSLGGNRIELVLTPVIFQSMATKLRELADNVEKAFWDEGKKYKLDSPVREKKPAATEPAKKPVKKVVKKVVKKR